MSVTKMVVVSQEFKVNAKPVSSKSRLTPELFSKTVSRPSRPDRTNGVAHTTRPDGSGFLKHQDAKVVLR